MNVLVGVEGIEPTASRSQSERSTDELHPECYEGLGIGKIFLPMNYTP